MDGVPSPGVCTLRLASSRGDVAVFDSSIKNVETQRARLSSVTLSHPRGERGSIKILSVPRWERSGGEGALAESIQASGKILTQKTRSQDKPILARLGEIGLIIGFLVPEIIFMFHGHTSSEPCLQ